MERDKLIAAAVVSLLAAASVYVYTSGGPDSSSLDTVLGEQGYSFTSQENFTLESSSSEEVAGIPVQELKATSKESRIDIQIFSGVSESFAENYVQNRREEIASIYTDKPAPYEGIPKKEVNCPDRFLPSFENSTESTDLVFELYSDQEMNIGVCSNSTAYHRTKLKILYCPETSNLIDFKFSRPVDENSAVEITCRQ